MKKSLVIILLILLAGCSSPLGGGDIDIKLESVKDKIIKSEVYTETICDGYKEKETATGTAMVCDKWKETEKVEYTYYDKEVTKSLKYKGYDEKKELRGLNYEVYDKGNSQYVMRYQLGDDKYKKIDNKFYEVKTEKIDKDKYDSQTTTLTDKILSFFGGDALADTNTNSTNNKDT